MIKQARVLITKQNIYKSGVTLFSTQEGKEGEAEIKIADKPGFMKSEQI
jgi:hypothetical protein